MFKKENRQRQSREHAASTMQIKTASRRILRGFIVHVTLVALCCTPIATRTATAAGTQHTVKNNSSLVKSNPVPDTSPINFEANRGQADATVKFIARSQNLNLLIAPGVTTINLHQQTSKAPVASFMTRGKAAALQNAFASHHKTPAPSSNEVTSVKMKLVSGNRAPHIEGLEKRPGTVSYLKGSDPQGWQTKIDTYGKVRARNVYPNIDQIFYGTGREIEYDFIVAPAANPHSIRLVFEGARDMRIDGRGDLLLDMEAGLLRQRAPVAYQELKGIKHPVAVRYVVRDEQVGFEIGSYNTRLPLVIDPVISYSTYLGGSGNDAGFDVAVDKTGNMYVVGTTDSAEVQRFGGSDVLVAKYDATGRSIYRNVYGGSGDDAGFSIAVDDAGNVYVTGSTDSPDLPIQGALQQNFGGGAQDAFVLKLNPDGSTAYSSYLGGEGSDAGFSIAVNKKGNAFITGSTDSAEYSTMGGSNVFVAKLNVTGNTREFFSILGGTGDETGFDIAVDVNDSAYITGVTDSDNFTAAFGNSSTAPKVPQPGFGGVQDAFVVKLDATGSKTIYSTYIGGTGSDAGFGIAVDAAGSAYITGATESSEFSTLGGRNVFIEKLTPAGDDRTYFAVIGGSGDDTGFGIAVDGAGNAYIAGSTDSQNFSTTRATQSALKGGQDAFIAKLNTAGSSLVYSSYFGGGGNDAGFSVTVDEGQRAYFAGFAGSDDLPTVGSAQPQNGGNGDAFVARIDDVLKKRRTFRGRSRVQ